MIIDMLLLWGNVLIILSIVMLAWFMHYQDHDARQGDLPSDRQLILTAVLKRV